MIGTSVHPRRPWTTSTPSRSGAEVEDDDIGRVCRGETERLGAGGRGVDVVVAGLEVDSQGPQQLGLVVDDEDAGHDGSSNGAGGRRSTMVSPPPGVSSMVTVPAKIGRA